MNGYELTASIIKSIFSLAWPAAFVLAVFMFKGRLKELLPFLSLRHKDTEIRFRLGEAAQEAATLPVNDEAIKATDEETGRFDKIAKLHPRGAILEAWTNVEAIVKEKLIASQTYSPFNGNMPISSTMRYLRRNGLITPTLLALFEDLRAVRNAAIHGTSRPTTEDALDFKRLSDKFINSFELKASPQKSFFE